MSNEEKQPRDQGKKPRKRKFYKGFPEDYARERRERAEKAVKVCNFI